MKETLLSKIKTLPPLPETVTRIQQICADPEASIGDLVKVVEKDPMITANLLKAANSPFYGFSREINSVSQAVSLFGMATVKGLALSGAVKKLLNVDLDAYNTTPNHFADVSQLQNALMTHWYAQVDRRKLDTLSVASFLQDTGMIVIAQEMAKDPRLQEFKDAIANCVSIAEVEQNFLGETTATVTAAVFDHWRLEESLTLAIRYSDTPSEAPEEIRDFATALAVVKAAVSVNKPFGEEQVALALKLAEQYGYNVEKFSASVEAVRSRFSVGTQEEQPVG